MHANSEHFVARYVVGKAGMELQTEWVSATGFRVLASSSRGYGKKRLPARFSNNFHLQQAPDSCRQNGPRAAQLSGAEISLAGGPPRSRLKLRLAARVDPYVADAGLCGWVSGVEGYFQAKPHDRT